MTLRRNVIANYLGQAWVAAMGLAFLPLYIRYLGIEAYGLVGLFVLMHAWLALLDMGMTPTLGREMARFTAGELSTQTIRNLLRSFEIVAYGLAICISIVLFAASPWLANYWLQSNELPDHVVETAIAVMAIVLSLRFVEGIYRSALIGLQRQVWYNAANCALATLRSLGAAIVLIAVSPTITAFFFWQAVVSVLSIVVFAIGVSRSVPSNGLRAAFSLQALQSIWRFAGGMTGIAILVVMLTQIDKVLLSRLLPLAEFGFYTLASVVSGSIYMLSAPVIVAIFPRLVQLVSEGNHELLSQIYHDAAQFLTLLTVPVALLFAFFGEGLIFAWSANINLATAAGPILSMLALGTLLNAIMSLPYHLQLAHGWTRLALFANIVAVLLLVPSILFVVPRYGALGAAYVWLILNIGYIVIVVQIMHRKLLRAEMWNWYVEDVFTPALCVAGVFFLSGHLKPEHLVSRTAWLSFLAAALVCAIVVAVATLPKIRRPVLQAMRERFVS